MTALPTVLASVHPRGRRVRCPSCTEVSGSVAEDSDSSQALMLVHPGRWGLSSLALSNAAMGPLGFFSHTSVCWDQRSGHLFSDKGSF